jgi:hypothetical protein
LVRPSDHAEEEIRLAKHLKRCDKKTREQQIERARFGIDGDKAKNAGTNWRKHLESRAGGFARSAVSVGEIAA